MQPSPTRTRTRRKSQRQRMAAPPQHRARRRVLEMERARQAAAAAAATADLGARAAARVARRAAQALAATRTTVTTTRTATAAALCSAVHRRHDALCCAVVRMYVSFRAMTVSSAGFTSGCLHNGLAVNDEMMYKGRTGKDWCEVQSSSSLRNASMVVVLEVHRHSSERDISMEQVERMCFV